MTINGPAGSELPVIESRGKHAAYARDAAAYHAQAKRAGRGKKIAIGIICAVLVVLLGAGVAFALYMGHINDQLTRGSKTDQELGDISDALGFSTSLKEPFNMLLIGSDKREDDEGLGARSDTNVVVRIDPKENIVTMISIPRDTKIDIKDQGAQKFNAAYAFGGAAGVIRAAEELTGVKINHYAEVSFSELASLVDAVGGVTVNIEETIDDPNCDDGDGKHYVIPKGKQTLKGGEALTFARTREYADGDFTRQKHQRILIEAIIDKVLDTPVTSMPSVVEAAAKSVTTDLSVVDVIGLAQGFADGKKLTMYSAMLPSYTQNINGISFVVNDEELTKEMMRVVNSGGDPSEIVSDKVGTDITTDDVDTSNVLLFNDDAEVESGSYSASTYDSNSGKYTASKSKGSSAASTASTGSGGNNTPASGGSGSGSEPSGGGDPSLSNTGGSASTPSTPSAPSSSGTEPSGSGDL